MDGTLFQTERILEKSLDGTFNYLRSQQKWHEITPIEKYREIMGVPLPQVWQTLLPTFSPFDHGEVDEYFLKCLIANIKEGNGELYPHAIETLTLLKEKGYDIFIASNGRAKYLQAIVDFYDFAHFLTEVYSIEQIDSLNKTDLVREIVQTHHIETGLVVGDHL